MRLFVAVVPPAPALEHLDDFLEPRRLADPDLRWTAPEQWHVTLAFLPDVAEHDVDELVERLGTASERRAAMRLAIEGGGAFPDAAAAKVLWAGLVDASAGGEGAGDAPRDAARDATRDAPRGAALPAPGRPPAPEELTRLAVGCRNAAVAAGCRVEGGRFTPHVTLARLPRAADVSGRLDVLDTYAGPAFDATEIALVESHLGQGPRRRPRYETLPTVPLGGRSVR